MIIRYLILAVSDHEGDVVDGHLVTYEDVVEMDFSVDGECMTIQKALVAAEEHLKKYTGFKISCVERDCYFGAGED